MKLTWFGHAAVRAENGSHVVLIDPFLSGNPNSTALDHMRRAAQRMWC